MQSRECGIGERINMSMGQKEIPKIDPYKYS
jgi:hypothetical protein